MRIFLETIGCRLNQSEIETYARQFRAAGHTLVAEPGQADLVVINTCAVTSAAVSDSRQKIRQAARAGGKQIVVTGCWSTLQPEGATILPGVSQVIPNSHKDQLVSEVLQAAPEVFDLEPVARSPVPGARLRTRAFIKVQDGCDNACTFCITTVARGRGRSRPVEDVLADVRASLQNGPDGDRAAKEIVLTGVHLGSWGQDLSPKAHLRQLVDTILRETEAPRLRLSSLEPWDLDAEFFSLWQDPRLCRHLHLPLQSGCAKTLKRMARKTTPASFATLVAAAREACPEIAVTTDVIVGFPGESEADYNDSLAYIRSLRLAGGHVFSYSARPGTAAARLPDKVPQTVRKERSARLRALLSESAQEYQLRFIGRTLPVLWESASALGPEDWKLSGLTDNYLRIHTRAPRKLWNQITPVKLTGLSSGELQGLILSD
jgi:threonylcarbamoyladenosine tRNA methylthiotransferase MtaB